MSAAASAQELVARVRAGDRGALARAITLVESSRPQDEEAAEAVLEACLPYTGRAERIGVSGVPGAGKSTFLDGFGSLCTAAGRTVAVLAVDPTSSVSGGSLLGDKTRMARLSRDPRAFVRPSPSGGSAGGVAARTREAMAVCEAAGFDVILVETVGAGQSDVAVAGMVDTFLVLLLAGAGDELQGIKRGIMELADVLVVHKADSGNEGAAQRARAEFDAAVRILHGGGGATGVASGGGGAWLPPVLVASSRTGAGLDDVAAAIARHRAALGADGLEQRRRRQRGQWFEEAWRERLQQQLLQKAGLAARLQQLRDEVRAGTRAPRAAARALLGDAVGG